MKTILMSLLLLIVVMFYYPSLAEKNINIDWRIQRGFANEMATVGDTIQFNWFNLPHNVFIHPSGDCNGANSIEIGSSSGAVYTFTEDDVGELCFACQIEGHCAAGQILKVIVSSNIPSLSIPIEWFVPFSTPDNIPALQAGDTLVFDWIGIHDIYKMTEIDGFCNFDNSIEIGQNPPVNYVITNEDVLAGEVTLACSIPGHCDSLNQIITVQTVPAIDIAIDWQIQTTYDDAMVTVGDTIQFKWAGVHNVYMHPSGSCSNEVGAIEIGQSSGATYTFTEDDIDEVYFVCQIPGHCAAGQILKVIVSNPNAPSSSTDAAPPIVDIAIDWQIQSYSNEMATVGDTIQFNWRNVHNVYLRRSRSCDEADSVEIGQSSGATYTFTEGDVGGEIYFVCQIPGHCAAGQILRVIVSAPTDAPTAAGGGGIGFCFSGSTIVNVLGKGPTVMSDLQLGDRVKTGGSTIRRYAVIATDTYETVYSFGHYNPEQIGEFLQITTISSNNHNNEEDTNRFFQRKHETSVIEMSKDHLILLPNSHFVPASTLQIGDHLAVVNDDNDIDNNNHTTTTTTTTTITTVVSEIKVVRRKGVYAPFTMSGSIVIHDGIIASTFVTLQQDQEMVTIGSSFPLLSAHTTAHLFESIHRVAYRFRMTRNPESYSPEGVSHWVDTPRKFFLALLEDYSVLLQLIILIPCLGILVVVKALEDYHKVVFCCVGGIGIVLSIVFHRRRRRQAAVASKSIM